MEILITIFSFNYAVLNSSKKGKDNQKMNKENTVVQIMDDHVNSSSDKFVEYHSEIKAFPMAFAHQFAVFSSLLHRYRTGKTVSSN